MNLYFVTWTIRSYSGKYELGEDLIPAQNKEEAELIILQKNSSKRIDTTDVRVYNFSELCNKYKITYELPKVAEKPKPKPAIKVHELGDEESEDIF